jgi:hypothetical protein
MDRYTKGFVVASLVYFFLAAVLGIWMGGRAPGWVHFAHVHFNLLGFMSMMIYGVGYFILPRFNGRTLHWPSWVPVHFYVANLGLVGMVATASERPSNGFVIFSILSMVSAGMFAVNLGATMLIEPKPEEEEEPSFAEKTSTSAGTSSASSSAAKAASEDKPEGKPVSATKPRDAPRIDPDMRVGEILTRWPETVDAFVGHGFASLANPEHREQVKQMPITLRMACQRHNVDLDYMVSELNEAIAPSSAPVAFPGAAASGATEGKPAGKAKKGKLSRGETIGADHILGEILGAYPETEKVFRKYYGDGCFSCPGQATESVKQSAMMHNVSEKQLLSELNRAAGF